MMKSLLLLSAVLALAGCAAAPAANEADRPAAVGGGTTLHVPAARQRECLEQGGCGLVTAREIEGALNEAFNMGALAGQQTCRRGRDS